MKYYVIWSDYDGVYVNAYENDLQAADACAEVLAKQEQELYGTRLQCVIQGYRLKAEEIQVKVITQVKLTRSE